MKKVNAIAIKTLLTVVGAAAVTAGGFSLAHAKARHGSAEGSIKAAYVFNFAKLTTWPSEGDIVIGIIGDSDAGDTIKRVVDGKSANGHTISVKSISAGGAKSCQMVFVCGSDGPPAVGGAHVLTVGEGDGFAENGGAIGFSSSDGKVRFSISRKALKKAGLSLSDKLMAIGKVLD